jgi:hypothetical protein
MQLSYIEFVQTHFQSVTDPFSLQSLPTELLCSPIAYLTQSEARVFEQPGDREDMQLLENSLKRDLPVIEQVREHRLAITDGASHLWGSRPNDSFALVLGIPAIGKTTMLKKIALLCANDAVDPESPVPLFVELSKLPPSAFISKMDFLEACFGQVEEYEAFLREKFYTGQLVLLLDGLETSCKYKSSLVDWVKSLRNIIQIPLVVIATRFNGYCEVPEARIVRIELFPLKLQISAAQLMLSEMQFERFIGLATSCGSILTEFAYTPLLLSLLFDMFRWGTINEGQVITKAKLNLMAVEHLVGTMSPKEQDMLQELAYELLVRGYREFCTADLRRLEVYEVWQKAQGRLELTCLFTKADSMTEHDMSYQTLELHSANDYSQISVDLEDPIHEIRDTKTLNFKLDESRQTSLKDVTPQWLDLSRYSIANYQRTPCKAGSSTGGRVRCEGSSRDHGHLGARGAIGDASMWGSEHDGPGDMRSAHNYGGEVFRFTHLSILESLAALRLNFLLSDILCKSSRSFLTETFVYQKAFSQCLSSSLLFSRGFRGCLMTFVAACDEFVFDYFVKYLVNFKTLEHLQLAEAALKENSASASLVLKVRETRAKLAVSQYIRGFCHPSVSVRRIAQTEVQQMFRGDVSLSSIFHQEVIKHIEDNDWAQLLTLRDYVHDSWRITRLLLSKLHSASIKMLKSSSTGEPYSPAVQASYISLVLKALEQPFDSTSTLSPVSSSNTASSQVSSPLRGVEFSFSGRVDPVDAESSMRLSFERLCIHPIEASVLDRLGSAVPKLVKSLYETLKRCEGVDMFSLVKLLILLNCSVSQLHSALASRLLFLPDSPDLDSVLTTIKELGQITQQSIEVPLQCLDSPKTSRLAREILEGVSPWKIKRFAMNFISKDDITEAKLCLALRALGFAERGEVDEESVHLLVQFCDHYDGQCRFEALNSLHRTLSHWRNKELETKIRKELAPVPHVLMDRLRLMRYDVNLQVISLKCLAWLWIVLDRDQTDLQKSQMLHVLVKEHIHTSYLVGSVDNLLGFMKRFLTGCPELRQCLWECLLEMQIGKLLASDEVIDLVDEFIRVGLADSLESVRVQVLQLLLQVPDGAFYDRHREPLRFCVMSDHTSVVGLASKLFFRLDKLSDLQATLPLVTSSGLCNCTSDPAALVRNFRVVLETLTSQTLSLLQSLEMRQLTRQYKAFVNYLAENLPLPAYKFPRDIRQSELLDVTYEMSKEETLPEFCESYIEMEAKASSNDSATTELEDVYVPPSFALTLQLLKAGVKAEVLKYWALWHLSRLALDAPAYAELAEVWARSWKIENFFEPKVELAILELVKVSPKHAVQAVQALKFTSDEVAIKLLGAVAKGELECSGKVIAQCAVLQSTDLLFILLKYLNFKHTSGTLSRTVQTTALAALTELRITREDQMEICVEFICYNDCPYIFQMVWAYLMSQVHRSPRYRLADRLSTALDNSKTWESSFLNRWCRSLGLLNSACNDDLSTQASRATPL